MDENERDIAIRQFFDSHLHVKINRWFSAILLLSIFACGLSINLLSVAVCNYVVPMLLISAMALLFSVAVRYQRNVTTVLDILGLLCHVCNGATVPRPDEMHMRKRVSDHDNSVCYKCGVDLLQHDEFEFPQ